MEREDEIKALEELRKSQQEYKQKSRVAFVAVLIIATILMIIFPTLMPRPIYTVVMIAGMVSIFGLVFLGRVGLMLTRRRFSEQRPHKRLAKLSEPDDLVLSIEEALTEIDARQERELAKRRLR